MQEDRRSSDSWLSTPDEVARVVLDAVLRQHPSIVAVEDLLRELCHSSLTQRIDEPLVQDALVDLTVNGLLHRLDAFILPTRASLRGGELLLG